MYYENTPTLETDRLILRKFNDNDIDDMFLLYRNEDVNKFLPFFPLKTRILFCGFYNLSHIAVSRSIMRFLDI